MSKYDEMYVGVSNDLNVYDSFLTEIEIAFKEDTSKTGLNFSIDNNNTEVIYPTVKFDTLSANEGENIVAINEVVEVREDISYNDVVLDFHKQEYTASGLDITNKFKFTGSDRPHIAKDSSSSVQLKEEGTVEYYEYPEQIRERFVERFRVNSTYTFNQSDTKMIDKEYSFDLNQFKTDDFTIRDKIEDGEMFRLKFRDVELENETEDYQYLLECNITDFDYSFNNMGDLILHSFSGDAKELINNNNN